MVMEVKFNNNTVIGKRIVRFTWKERIKILIGAIVYVEVKVKCANIKVTVIEGELTHEVI
jgi:hypothetical protein